MADDKSNISISEQSFSQERPLSYEELREFYLWGGVPSTHDINLSDAILKKAHFQDSNVSIEVYRTGFDIVKAIITLGMYCPVHYKLSIIGKEYEEDNYL